MDTVLSDTLTPEIILKHNNAISKHVNDEFENCSVSVGNTFRHDYLLNLSNMDIILSSCLQNLSNSLNVCLDDIYNSSNYVFNLRCAKRSIYLFLVNYDTTITVHIGLKFNFNDNKSIYLAETEMREYYVR